VSVSTLLRSLLTHPDVVRQHATPKCAPTPITTVTILVRNYKPGMHFVLELESVLLEPSLHDLAAPYRPFAAH
jgi:hypothetical protein